VAIPPTNTEPPAKPAKPRIIREIVYLGEPPELPPRDVYREFAAGPYNAMDPRRRSLFRLDAGARPAGNGKPDRAELAREINGLHRQKPPLKRRCEW
jgi:hypothetical protein